MSKPVFIAAIGTECGKTHVSGAILRELITQKRPALGLKPLMSGYAPESLETSDVGRLLIAMGRPITPESISDICWKSFTEWSAPNVAARRAGVRLDYAELVRWVRSRLDAQDAAALVEGAGGVMSPLTDTHTNLDLMADLNSPIVLMASNYLGAVTHTLTALEAMARRDMSPAVIVVTETLPNAGPAAPLVEELGRWTNVPVLRAAFARTSADDRGYAGELVRMLFA